MHSDQPKPVPVHAIFWNALGPGSVGYTLTELFDNLPAEGIERRLWCLSARGQSPRDYQSPAFPDLIYRLLCKAGISMPVQGRLARGIPLRKVEPGDIVYAWPPYDLRLIKRAQERGAIVVAERINCMGAMCRDVLSRAFWRRGAALPEGWFSEEAVNQEREQMLQCDFVTAPNSFVTESLLDAGMPRERILETSYGYSARRLGRAIGIQRPKRKPVFAFVGVGIVRKGLDVLLEAWDRANPDAILLIAGRIDDEIQSAYATTLSRADVRQLGFVDDIASVYVAADVFVFPTHEEGGPQVTYEAAACGLASIVSPMGAGRVVRDGIEGIFVDPLSVGQVAEALTTLSRDSELRELLGANAAERARSFEWSDVGLRLFGHFRRLAVASTANAIATK